MSEPFVVIASAGSGAGDDFSPEVWLDGAESARHSRFRVEGAATAFLLGRVLLKTLIATQTREAPSDVRLHRSEFGHLTAPSAPALSFSLSHTDGLVVAALAKDCLLGVDAESLSRLNALHEWAPGFCSEREWAHLSAAGFDPWTGLAYWTCKEAALKAVGLGFHIDPREVDVHFGTRVHDVSLPADPRITTTRQAVRTFSVGGRWMLALSGEVPAPGDIRMRTIHLDTNRAVLPAFSVTPWPS